MPGDYTRVTFNPFEDHLGVLMQQGRVMLDADFNEWIEIVDRRLRAETTDIIGRCVVPLETPDGFGIHFSGGTLVIGRGRLYANGLLAENHGKAPLEFDPILAEERGTLPIPYLEQPYLPNAATVSPIPDGGGPHLVYVDVWQREVTFLEEPDLVEKAVGVDTATRLQTVWQVKILPKAGQITCDTPDDRVPGWNDIIRSSAGRLTTATAGVPADTDPCVVNPAGGFRGTENRLYRIEIHDRGGLGAATFKWSRDNASVATSVTAFNAGLDILTVVRTGRDSLLRFKSGDWVEVTDDFHEFAGQPGEMRKVQSVDDVAQTITLAAALPAGAFDTAAPASRHTRVRRWDQKGQVFDSNNNVVADVDASGGVIPVPASGNIILEDGVQVSFSVSGAGDFHTADYWLVAARTVDASIDILTEAPPRGIHHHFCRLAIVTFPSTVIDCRTFWPPDFGGQGGGCDCTQCVSAASHNSGAFTIQAAIDLVKAVGGKVCLGPGIYNLSSPILVQGASSIQIQGHGWRTLLLCTAGGPAIFVSQSSGVDITMLSVLALNNELASFALGVQNSTLVRVERCMLLQSGRQNPLDAAIGLNGFILESTFRDNILVGAAGLLAISSGVATPATTTLATSRTTTTTFDLRVEDNLIVSAVKGVSLENLTVMIGQTRISGNTIYNGSTACVIATGLVFSDVVTSSRLDITGNSLLLNGDGIVIGVDNARVSDNDLGILSTAAARIAGGTGIVLTNGAGGTSDRVQVIANRMVGLGGDGISIRTTIGSAMIKQNIMEGLRGGGITTTEAGRAENVAIEDNQILRSGFLNDAALTIAAIQVARVRDLQITDNTIDQFALASVQNPARFGIEVVACDSIRVEGNDLSNVGPPAAFVKQGAGIIIESPFDRVDIGNNSVRRSTLPSLSGGVDSSAWSAIIISSPVAGSATGAAPTGSILFPFVTSFNNGVLVLGNGVIAALPPGSQIVGIRGNLVEGYGGDSTVKILTGASCVFSDNRGLLGLTPGLLPVALISAGAAIVNANLLRRVQSSDASFSMILNTGNGPFTILGNIFAGGRASVNGNATIPSPWTPLNVVTFS